MDKAWLTAMAAVLGVSEACHHDAPDAVREVAPLASTTPSASAEPSATAMVEAAPSASESAAPSASASSVPMPTPTSTLRIGAGTGQPALWNSCGARASTPKPTARINASIESGIAGDTHVIATLHARFLACANQGLAQDPGMSGRVVVYVNLAANGSVIDTQSSRIIGLSQSVADCMIASIKRAQFVASTPRHASVSIVQTQP